MLMNTLRLGIKTINAGASSFVGAITSQQLHCQNKTGSCSNLGENALTHGVANL